MMIFVWYIKHKIIERNVEHKTLVDRLTNAHAVGIKIMLDRPGNE